PRADILLQVAASRFALDLPRSASDALARIDPTRLTERERFAFFELANSIHHRLFQFDRALDFAAQETVLLNDAWSARLHSASTLAAMGNRTGLLGLIGDLDIPVAARTLLLERVVGELRAHGTPDLADSLQGELVEAYRELLRLAPQSSEYRLGLARSLYRMGRADLASELVRGLLGRMGRNPTSLGLQGTILARLGNAEAALNVMENLNTFDRPGDPGRSRYEQSRIATALDDWNLAIDLLIEAHQQGVDLYPTHADPDFIRLQDFGPYRVLIRPKG
ncbi:MAG: tetratricopeptide repeat protein, partial [Gemmatimonadales bacterium]